MKLLISDKEYKFIKLLAIGRHFFKDIVIPDRDMQRWNNTQHDADIIGVIGEYVVAKYLSIPFDTSINLNGDGGEVDMYYRNFTIQVKSTKYNNGRLVFNSIDEIGADIYVIVICNVASLVVDIAGVISKSKINKCFYCENLGFGNRICINQSELTDISILKSNF